MLGNNNDSLMGFHESTAVHAVHTTHDVQLI